ncbi:exonuclease SbcCD subunit D C-terminal domain-containing protein [Methylobacterium sp. Leaf123]|uniref:exonuclease SbcCD subunit D C-terminal domain-containing protein n=1 Tax=Methylobacterium sp. Leaf123 TaxID=1736264 RepID=UPI0012E93956|nr:exonuclease SbcCD subunit D C-terminal domain-containing protein [Methylobacterium sp. Leaf123]
MCEAELASRDLSPVHVTWGGSQTAADGGLDVRVALPAGTSIDGFIPRTSTGFQVKTPDMPRAAIIAEMRPTGVVRPVIQELADEAGAYIIVSSQGSTADRALRNRQSALQEAVADVPNASQLRTDFYDRTRLATWVRRHPGLITWVKEKIGQALVGWRPYGPWSGAAEAVEAEYLTDEKLRLHIGKHRDTPGRPVAEAIDDLRDELTLPGKMVRLVGLSGVGKTRLVQALFDPRIGTRPIDPSLAVYTNLSDNPDPQPTGLASDLIASRTRAVIVVDNCPPDLHRRLSELCSASASTVSVVTVEYDVRDDQPEGTQVVTLDTASPDLIEKLIRRRYSHLSEVDARTIAEASGGNARIAIALAGTVESSETVAGLSDDDLFQRLFRQRHEPDNVLLRAAQACSLVYSFQGVDVVGDDAELPQLAMLADLKPSELYRQISELIRRDLVQQRSSWRAVLPHAVANRLAARALEETPYDLIDKLLVTGGTPRLARSFSRRLSFLHEHHQAIAVVSRWLAEDGLLGDVASLNTLGQEMFENVAPVQPTAALSALARVDTGDVTASAVVWRRYQSLLHSLAYDRDLFDLSADLLARAVIHGDRDHDTKSISDTFASLFTIYLSGTHATVDQRVSVLERLLQTGKSKQQSLALSALREMLKTTHFSSCHRFNFGARPRNYGFRPKTREDIRYWYGAAISLIERFASTENPLSQELRDLLAVNFRGLWSSAGMFDELENLARRIAADGFWREGWAACRQTMSFDKDQLSPAAYSRLSNLEDQLKPSNIVERVRAVVLGDRFGGLDLEDFDDTADYMSRHERREALARELGAAVAIDNAAFAALLPGLLRGGVRTWSFGCGLASAAADHIAMWASFVSGLDHVPLEQRDVQILKGYIFEIWNCDQCLAHELLERALCHPALMPFVPFLHTAIRIDSQALSRLKRILGESAVPVGMYRCLAFAQAVDHLDGGDFRDLILLIADKPEGFDVALKILYMRLFSDRSAARHHDPKVVQAGAEMLRRLVFRRNNQREAYELAEVAEACLSGNDGASLAADVVRRLRQAVSDYETYEFDNSDLLRGLIRAQPIAVLDALFEESAGDDRNSIRIFGRIHEHQSNPADEISQADLIGWCRVEQQRRFPIAASFVTFASHPDGDKPLAWSPQATSLLVHSPNPMDVLNVFIRRFRPSSWSGSLAALIEANSLLLDMLPAIAQSKELDDLVSVAKRRLAEEVAAERRRETAEDRERDERFE